MKQKIMRLFIVLIMEKYKAIKPQPNWGERIQDTVSGIQNKASTYSCVSMLLITKSHILSNLSLVLFLLLYLEFCIA